MFSDGSRTDVPADDCDGKFEEHFIPSGSRIAQVQTMYDNYDKPFLVGLKFLDAEGKVLLSTGLIDKETRRNNPQFPIESFSLKPNQRLIGVASYQAASERYAQHFSLTFTIASGFN